MRLYVRDCAKIESADIVIDGITVIAGANNTGKSTVGKILFSFFNAMNGIDDKILQERKRVICSECLRHITDFLRTEEFEDYTARRRESIRIVIRRKVYDLPKEELTEENIVEIVEEILSPFVSDQIRSNLGYEEMLGNCWSAVKSLLDIPEEVLSKEVLSRYFNGEFNGQINSLHKKGTESKIGVEIKGKKIEFCFVENECSAFETQLSIMNKAIYIDNPFVLDSLNNYVELNSRDTFLRKLLLADSKRDVMDGIIESVMAKEKLDEIKDVLGNVVSGKITKDSTGEYYFEEESIHAPVAFGNLSTGVKAFVLLKMLLEKGILKNKDVLILDEPEIHLHPEWQVAYAEVLVLIQKYFDLSVVIATHSPYFVDAINLFSIRYETDKKVNYYLSELDENGVRMDCVTDDIERIYQKMASPIQVLDTLRYELNNR
ncbi:MAG: ATP-binding protein [Lachnospiraceae bacterium]|nr:ATP-binding protein [Lachnospiraceae bacterium]